MKGVYKYLIIYLSLCILIVPFGIYSHPGRLDQNGGHRDTSTGQYHYHITSEEIDKVHKESLKQLKIYLRTDWTHWIDEDKNGLNTRHEVLLRQSLVPAKIKNDKVVEGMWFSAYTGEFFYEPTKLDIDHFVPLKNAHDTGGANWSKEKKKYYANNLEIGNHLLAVSRSANRSKGSKSPLEWLPSNKDYSCEYIKIWIELKNIWELELEDLSSISNRVCAR